MTEFPALREALVGAATRRRQRRRALGAAVPLFSAATAAVAALVLSPAPAPNRERVARPPATALESAFAVFRRPQRASDRMPSLRVAPGTVDTARTRLLGQGGPTRFFAAPTTDRGVPKLCLVAIRRRVASAAGCEPVARAIRESSPPGIAVGGITGVFLPDGSTDLRFIFTNGVGSVGAKNNLSLSMNPVELAAGTSWTGASGTRYIRYTAPQPTLQPAPTTCPKALEDLPADALAKARRAALIAVDRLYPQAMQATVTAAAKPAGTPCDAAITKRSIEVSLRLVPRDRKQRSSASLSQGRLLLGMQNGSMRVFYLLH